ncbi:nitroreductase family protein [Microbulbifer variabilis]|uniref:nitroreductase family protein n=1 Tax=Microbulbifer variabilis TaxID=266805 RepID=UPI001B7FBAFD|nr:nitroreductase family protein [Microbulbifer variabilis]
MKDVEQRNYTAVKIYHSLEKSMSFKNRRVGSGWSDAYALLDLLRVAHRFDELGYHDKAACKLLSRFIELEGNSQTKNASYIRGELSKLNFASLEEHGVKTYSAADFHRGVLKSPEAFFLSRYSLREFKGENVSEELIKRAISLAMKSPSVCNRQAWHVYHTTESLPKEAALKYQAGNRGFGERIPNLMVVTTDLKAFMPGQEHYQHWIDGGLFSMSLIYALHSLGVASCCLNWSQSPANDKLLRSSVNIKNNHTVVMMLAVGWPEEVNNVCVSARRPLDEIYTCLEVRAGGCK